MRNGSVVLIQLTVTVYKSLTKCREALKSCWFVLLLTSKSNQTGSIHNKQTNKQTNKQIPIRIGKANARGGDIIMATHYFVYCDLKKKKKFF